MTDSPSSSYALRVQPRAARGIDSHLLRPEQMGGPEVALAWCEGILAAIGSLSQNPRRCARIPEQARFRRETRHLLYHRTARGPAWRLLFTITGEGEGVSDPPTVHLLHVRHAAERPVTPFGARVLEIREP